MDSVCNADTPLGDTSCGLYVNGLGHGKSNVENKECVCWNKEETAKLTLQGTPNDPFIGENDVLTVQEADVAPLVLPVCDLQAQLSCNATSDEKVLEAKHLETHQELRHFASSDGKKQKALTKSATFPSSAEVDPVDLSMDDGCGMPCSAFQHECSSAPKNPTYARSVSLPAPSKLISAIKGSRAQNGSPSNVQLHVKWAPEVYDPPCTTVSHTVKKSHHQRPRAKKKDGNKHKHKGKSARGSNTERSTNRSSVGNVAESVDTRSQSTGDVSLLNGYDNSSMEVLKYAVSKQDSKCGNTFLREALTKVHISMAEAT
ncbi:hypothetical protein MUK42_05180 [Musa troglodytarum]|nr:hypothetical protein MUK42_05180 [Musa troglodytarum]URD79494.1 hypothetical protein MUK42_05180 [Musa troglodytarum]URD79495.1 hypothetical protein MUK42_05180 [Musa troglodytarum]